MLRTKCRKPNSHPSAVSVKPPLSFFSYIFLSLFSFSSLSLLFLFSSSSLSFSFLSLLFFLSFFLSLCQVTCTKVTMSYVHFRARPCSSTCRWARLPSHRHQGTQCSPCPHAPTLATQPPQVCHRRETGLSPLARTRRTWTFLRRPHMATIFPETQFSFDECPRLVGVCPDETRRWRGRCVTVREIPNATPCRVATFTRTPIGLLPTGTIGRKKGVTMF